MDHPQWICPAAPFPRASLRGDSPYTVAAWVKAAPGTSLTGGWLGYGNNADSQGNNFRLGNGSVGGDNDVWEYWYNNDFGATLPGNETFYDGFHSVVATWDGTTEDIYLDGVLAASREPSAPDIGTSLFVVGNTTNDADFTGWVDDLTIINQALSPAQIPIVMNGFNPTISSLSQPSAVTGGASFPLTVNGTFFQSDSTMKGNGAALSTSYVSPTQLTATVPASDLAVPYGSASITVTNPTTNPGTSPPAVFYLDAPGATAPTLTNPTSTSITYTSATLGGTVAADNGAIVQKRGILYAPTSTDPTPTLGDGIATEVDDAAGTGTFAESVSGLNPNTSYSFVAFAANDIGAAYTAPYPPSAPRNQTCLAGGIITTGISEIATPRLKALPSRCRFPAPPASPAANTILSS